MTPGKYDLDLYRGDSYSWQFKLWQDAGKTQPVDLTGAIAKAEIRDKPAGTPIIPLVCSINSPATAGTITMTLSAGSYGDLLYTGGSWDLQVIFAGGTVQTMLAGAVTIKTDVTDSVVVV